jgi:DNA-binding GntR family transcriptional regulator
VHHFVSWERATVGEKADRIEDFIRGGIASGDLPAGGKIPSERHLAESLDASRTTVRLVLARLSAAGVIRPVHGSGYFVCGDD